MTTRSEQLSVQFTLPFAAPFSAPFAALGQSQLQTQLDLLQSWSTRALDSASQLISLNLRASRTSVEQATGTFKQLLDATNPRDVIAVGSRTQGQWHYLFEYGRELLDIATSGAPLQTWTTQPSARVPSAPLHLAHTANVPTSVSQAFEQASIAVADTTTVTTEIAAAAADTGAALAEAGLHATTQAVARAQSATETAAEAATQSATESAIEATETAADTVDNAAAAAYTASAEATQQADALQQQVEAAIETAIADDVPPAKATPLAEALNDIAPKPASAGHPIASTIALEASDHVELPLVTPVEAEPPVHVPVPPPAAKERRTRGRK